MEKLENRFRKAIENGEFVITLETIPGRGAAEPNQEKELAIAKEVWETGRIHAVSITDCPSGNPALAPDAFAQDMIAQGVVPLVHLSCKDRNRNAFESMFYAMQRRGVENLLCMTGDHNGANWMGQSRPVFDLDPVTLLQMVGSMNAGMGYPTPKGEIARATPSDFFAGAVVSPFKWTEGEVITQFFKLKKKVHAGAKFIISQVGYSPRKMQEMLWMMQDAGIDVPLIANIYVLSAGAGAFMNKGNIPGCDVSDDLLARLREERDSSDDKGKEARFVRAAKMIAIAKGLGYGGVHIGGAGLDTQAVLHILDMAQEFEADWLTYAAEEDYPEPGCFWYYQEDPETHLNKREQNARTQDLFHIKKIRGNYRLSHWFHGFMFKPRKFMNKIFSKIMRSKDDKKGALRKHSIEHLGKVVLYDCMDCGDCGLWACGYTCPMTQCPKCQRNGPCGGSHDGWCEVYPGERYCIWYKGYYRMKHYGEEGKMDDYIVPPNQWKFWQKSPWSSMCKGRDSYARREWLPDGKKDEEFLEGPHADPKDVPQRY